MELGFWENLKRPVMALAPMSGVSDEPFRRMFLKYGKPDVFWTEFVSVDGLFSRGKDACMKVLSYSEDERPILAQIFGSDPGNFEKAAALIAELGFDGIDINMGCPDRGVESRGAGASLMKTPELAREIIKAAKRGAGKLPVSVKTRIGYDKNEIEWWIPAVLQEGVAALTVHFRTKKEMYFPPAHWELAKDVLRLRDKYSPETLVLGNGDIKSLEQAKQLSQETGLDGIMIGRAALGNPWFFTGREPSVAERLEAMLLHINLFEELKNGRSFADLKKHFHACIKGFRGAKELREQLMNAKNSEEAKTALKNFPENFKLI